MLIAHSKKQIRIGCRAARRPLRHPLEHANHRGEPLGICSVITGANAAVLSSNVYDAFVSARYVANNARIAQPIVCYKAMSEPGLLTGSGGRGVVVPSRGFQVMGKKPAPTKKKGCNGSSKEIGMPIGGLGPCPGGILVSCDLLDKIFCGAICPIFWLGGCYKCIGGTASGIWCDCLV